MEHKLFVVALLAKHGRICSTRPGCVIALDEDHAKGKALRLAKEAFPPDEGWGNHGVAVGEIPTDMIDEVIARRKGD